jgi:hypothetical protein
MEISKTAIYSSAVMLTLFMGGPAQAQKQGIGPPAGQPVAPGLNKPTDGHGASSVAPGRFSDQFKGTPGGASSYGGGVGKQGGAPGQAIAPGYLKNNPASQ